VSGLLPKHLMLAVAIVATVFASPVDARKKNGVEVRDLYYGEVLFYFYQQNDFAALTRILAAQSAGRLDHHEGEAELLLGGLYLSYGQHELASEIFERLLDESVDSNVRNRAWFYVGKMRYQRSRYAGAEEAFAKIDGRLPRGLEEEHQMLLAQTYMGQGRFAEAAELLDRWKGSREWQAYARYNLGVSYVRTNAVDEGARLLNKIGLLDEKEPELLNIRDKANLALGYAYLQSERAEDAKGVLQRVRLQGPFSNKALLGVGWADAMRDDYRAALTPWLELQGRDLLDSAVQESLLAVPFAFGNLGANGSAAEYYQSALRAYEEERVRLRDAIDQVQTGELIPALLASDDENIARWYWQLEELPASAGAKYIYHLVANHEFQEGLRNYRDLMVLYRDLNTWKQKLGAFHDMVDTRKQAYAQRLPDVEASLQDMDVNQMRERRDGLIRRRHEIRQTRDIAALATEDERWQWGAVTELEANPAFNVPEAAEARDKQRLLKGVLLWNFDKEYKFRLWQLRREIEALNQTISVAVEYQQRVAEAQASMPQKLEAYARRIDNLEPRLEAMQQRIYSVLAHEEQRIETMAAKELTAQLERLETYQIQARFALAAIYDRATAAATE